MYFVGVDMAMDTFKSVVFMSKGYIALLNNMQGSLGLLCSEGTRLPQLSLCLTPKANVVCASVFCSNHPSYCRLSNDTQTRY